MGGGRFGRWLEMGQLRFHARTVAGDDFSWAFQDLPPPRTALLRIAITSQSISILATSVLSAPTVW